MTIIFCYKYIGHTSAAILTQQVSHVLTHVFLVLSQKHEFEQLQL